MLAAYNQDKYGSIEPMEKTKLKLSSGNRLDERRGRRRAMAKARKEQQEAIERGEIIEYEQKYNPRTGELNYGAEEDGKLN